MIYKVKCCCVCTHCELIDMVLICDKLIDPETGYSQWVEAWHCCDEFEPDEFYTKDATCPTIPLLVEADLLAVCEAVAKDPYPDSDLESLLTTLRIQARAAIAKAKGETS